MTAKPGKPQWTVVMHNGVKHLVRSLEGVTWVIRTTDKALWMCPPCPLPFPIALTEPEQVGLL